MSDSAAAILRSENEQLKLKNESLRPALERLLQQRTGLDKETILTALDHLERQRRGLEKASEISPETREKMRAIVHGDDLLDLDEPEDLIDDGEGTDILTDEDINGGAVSV